MIVRIKEWIIDKWEWLKTFNNKPNYTINVPLCFGVDDQCSLTAGRQGERANFTISAALAIQYGSSDVLNNMSDEKAGVEFKKIVNELKMYELVGNRWIKKTDEEYKLYNRSKVIGKVLGSKDNYTYI